MMASRSRSCSFSLLTYAGSSSVLKHVWLVGSLLLSPPSPCTTDSPLALRSTHQQLHALHMTGQCFLMTWGTLAGFWLRLAVLDRLCTKEHVIFAGCCLVLPTDLDGAAEVGEATNGRAV
jgi:hypothetical protein